MTGTLINIVAVLIGGLAGTALGNRLPVHMRETVMHGLGLATLAVGTQLTLSQLAAAEASLQQLTFIVVLGSILIGGLLGEALSIDDRLANLGRWLEESVVSHSKQAAGATAGAATSTTFSRGFVTASLVFCVGPMTIIGSLRDGLSGDFTLLAIKSVLDGFAALAFASSLGIGVVFSILTILVYQGGLSLAARWITLFLSDAAIAEMSAAGGILMLGIGFTLLDIKRVRVANLLPAIVVAPVLTAVAVPLARLL